MSTSRLLELADKLRQYSSAELQVPNPKNPKTSDPTAWIARAYKRIGLEVAKAIADLIKVDQIGVVVLSPSNPDTWKLVAKKGFPKASEASKNSLHQLGGGLTLETLSISRPGSWVAFADIEKHPSWTSISRTLQRDLNQVGPMAFIGMPLFVANPFQSEGKAFGALLVSRFSGNANIVSPFKDCEIEILRLICTLAEGVLKEIVSHLEMQSKAVMVSELCRVSRISHSASRQLNYLLQLINRHGCLTRLMISTVSSDHQTIVGQEVVGYNEDLVIATKRKLMNQEEAKEAINQEHPEDILSYVVREVTPRKFIIVDTNNLKDPLYQHIDNTTAKRHKVERPMVFMPIHDKNLSRFFVNVRKMVVS